MNEIEIASPEELYKKYPGQTTQQPCFVTLNCNNGKLSAEYDPNIGGGISLAVYHGIILRWKIPCLTADACLSLLEDIKEKANMLLGEHEIIWKNGNKVGKLSDTGKEIDEEISKICEDKFSDYDDILNVWEVSDYLCNTKFAITVETTDQELQILAQEIIEEAIRESVNLDGDVLEYLRKIRNDKE